MGFKLSWVHILKKLFCVNNGVKRLGGFKARTRVGRRFKVFFPLLFRTRVDFHTLDSSSKSQESFWLPSSERDRSPTPRDGLRFPSIIILLSYSLFGMLGRFTCIPRPVTARKWKRHDSCSREYQDWHILSEKLTGHEETCRILPRFWFFYDIASDMMYSKQLYDRNDHPTCWRKETRSLSVIQSVPVVSTWIHSGKLERNIDRIWRKTNGKWYHECVRKDRKCKRWMQVKNVWRETIQEYNLEDMFSSPEFA